MDKSRQGHYLSRLLAMDKKGNVPFERSDEGDIELSDLLLSVEPSDEMSGHRTVALQAIEIFYNKRPITMGSMNRFCIDLEKSEDGRAVLMLEASTTAFGCEAVAAMSAVVGVYELAAAFFTVGAYQAYEAVRIARKNNG